MKNYEYKALFLFVPDNLRFGFGSVKSVPESRSIKGALIKPPKMSSRGQRGARSRRSHSEECSPIPTHRDEEIIPPLDDANLEDPELDSVNPIDRSILEEGAIDPTETAQATEATIGEAAASVSGLPLGHTAVGQRRVALPNPICAAAYEESEGASAIDDRRLYEEFVAKRSKAIQQSRNKQSQAPFAEKRGKVHWDHLLEEMEWLAKDFAR